MAYAHLSFFLHLILLGFKSSARTLTRVYTFVSSIDPSTLTSMASLLWRFGFSSVLILFVKLVLLPEFPIKPHCRAFISKIHSVDLFFYKKIVFLRKNIDLRTFLGTTEQCFS